MRRFLILGFIFSLTFTGVSNAAITFTLPGTTEVDYWNNFTGDPATFLSLAPNTDNTGESLKAVFPAMPSAGPPAPMTTEGAIYSGGKLGQYTVNSSTAFNVANVILQVAQSGVASNPLLSFNSGTQNIAANYLGTATAPSIGGNPATYFLYQWDLSSYSSIQSYSIDWSTSFHVAITDVNLTSGSVFVQVVPEPSRALLAALALGTFVFRRKRKTQA